MRAAILADIYANLTALEAVEADIRRDGGVDAVWCLGDVVGYGSDPNECVDWVRRSATSCVAGNHDWAAIGRLDTRDFNDAAAEAATWTAEHLTAQSREFLEAQPLRESKGDFLLVHGSPGDPLHEYLRTAGDAAASFARFDRVACFVGHTHVPLAFVATAGDAPGRIQVVAPEYGRSINLGANRHIVNAGSVGQPRDGDPAARYLILDNERRSYRWRRVEYDVRRAQARIRGAGLPTILWMRLAYGR